MIGNEQQENDQDVRNFQGEHVVSYSLTARTTLPFSIIIIN